MLMYDLVYFIPATTSLISTFGRSDLTAIDVVGNAKLHDALVFQVQHGTSWLPYGAVFPQNSPLLEGNVIWARDRGTLDSQLMRAFPGRHYYRLDGRKLSVITPTTTDSTSRSKL
jgi:hypothetical protein